MQCCAAAHFVIVFKEYPILRGRELAAARRVQLPVLVVVLSQSSAFLYAAYIMSDHDADSPELAAELAKLEEKCQQALREMSSTRTVRETLHLAEVDIPHHLRSIAKAKVPSLGRMGRTRDIRVEEVVKNQLSSLSMERSEPAASREFDRIKAADWPTLRSSYPDIYNKAIREANLILERKRKRS